jgi:hypothetical protein
MVKAMNGNGNSDGNREGNNNIDGNNNGNAVGLLAPSQRYSTVEEEEACRL